MEVSMNVQSYSYTTEIKRNQTAENTSSFSEIRAAESQEAISESHKTKKDWFTELCNRYPNVSFIVCDDEYGINDYYEYESVCDTKRFSYPGTRSYTISESILERMNDPGFKEKLYGVINHLERNYNRLIEESPSEYRCIDIQLMKDGKIKYGTAGCSGPMSYYIDASNKSSNNLSLTYQEMIMKKISVMEDKTYQKLVEDLFDDKDDKADSDKKRRMEQEYADRFETHQRYINGEISSREYSYN